MAVVVVCAAFDAVADERIGALRDELEQAGNRVRRAHRPHLTLAAARTGDIDAVVEVCRRLAERHHPIPVTFTGRGSFPSGVLYLALGESAALRSLQRDADRMLLERGLPPAFGATTEPAQWVPHCTLTTRIPRGALARLRRAAGDPFDATVEGIAVITVGGRGDVAHLPLPAA